MDKIMALIVRFIVFIARFAPLLSKFGWGSYDKWEKGKVLKILMVGYNGARNTGADVRVVAIVEQIEKIIGKKNIEISIMTLDIDKFSIYFEPHIKLVKLNPIFFWDVFKNCSSSHLAILCEGSTLKSKFANALSMFFCEAAGIMKVQNKPCIAYGSEVGEMDSVLEKLAKDMCKETYFIARTQASLERVKELGLKGHLGTDTAWTFRSKNNQDFVYSKLLEAGWDGMKPILGIAVINPFWWPVKPSVSKWLKGLITGKWELHFSKWYFFSWSNERERQFDRYLSSISESVRRFTMERDMFVVIIGMEELDSKAAQILKKRMGDQIPLFLSKDYDGYHLAELLRSLSFLITSRYHAQVLSMDRCVPTVALSMDERLENIIREIGFDQELLYSVEEQELEQKIYTSLCYIENNREKIQNQIANKLPYYFENMENMGSFLGGFVEKHFPEVRQSR